VWTLPALQFARTIASSAAFAARMLIALEMMSVVTFLASACSNKFALQHAVAATAVKDVQSQAIAQELRSAALDSAVKVPANNNV
jgi:precorrin-6B methylase 1